MFVEPVNHWCLGLYVEWSPRPMVETRGLCPVPIDHGTPGHTCNLSADERFK